MKQRSGKRVHFSPHIQVTVHNCREVTGQGAPGRRPPSHPQSRAERNEWSHAHLDACLCSYTVRTQCLGIGASNRGLSLSTSKQSPTDTPTGQSDPDKPSLRPRCQPVHVFSVFSVFVPSKAILIPLWTHRPTECATGNGPWLQLASLGCLTSLFFIL